MYIEVPARHNVGKNTGTCYFLVFPWSDGVNVKTLGVMGLYNSTSSEIYAFVVDFMTVILKMQDVDLVVEVLFHTRIIMSSTVIFHIFDY